MDRLSVLEARKLLHGAISASSAKETELQLMVGSRYHELIESADAIVSMHSTAAELRERLHHLPEAAQFLIQAQSSNNEKSTRELSKESNDEESASAEKYNDAQDSVPETVGDRNELFFRNVLTIPPRIWRSLDEHRFYDAASALLEWSSAFDILDDGKSFIRSLDHVPTWFHEFELYMNQLPCRITKDALRQLQQRQYQSKDYAGALVALSIINMHDNTENILTQFLESRSKWIARGLDRFDEEFVENRQELPELEWSKLVQKRLRVAVRSLRRTICDVHVLFLGSWQSSGGGHNIDVEKSMVIGGIIELVGKRSLLRNKYTGKPTDATQHHTILIDPDKVKNQVTSWFASEVRHIIDSSQSILKGAHTASALAFIRQALWNESTDFKSYGSMLVEADNEMIDVRIQKQEENNQEEKQPKRKLSSRFSFKDKSASMKEELNNKKSDQDLLRDKYEIRGLIQWGLDCEACIDGELLADLLAGAAIRSSSASLKAKDPVSNNTRNGNGKSNANGIDLWSLLFSRTFSELGESLLHTSLRNILQDVSHKVDVILELISSKHHPHTPSSSLSSLLSFETFNAFPSGHKSYELLYCSEKIMNDFESQLYQLSKDASSLVQDGDKEAAEDLSKSLYLKSVEMISCLVNELRRKNNSIIQESTTASTTFVKRMTSTSLHGEDGKDGNVTATVTTVVNKIDASLLVARVSKVLITGCKTLQSLLTNIPKFYQMPHPDRISMEQLHAAFIVTDNNGDGELYAEECTEAIESVLVCGHLLKLDASRMPTVTLSEFALFATCILESAAPFEYLSQCCDSVFHSSYACWSKDMTSCLKVQLFSELSKLTSSASQSQHKLLESAWRCEHGLWVEVGDDDDTMHTTNGKRGSVYISEKVKGTRSQTMKDKEKEWQQNIGANGSDKPKEPATPSKTSFFTPGSVSLALQRFLFSASSELTRVISLSDSIHVSTEDTKKDTNKESVLVMVRSMFLKEMMSALASIYHEISLNVANFDSCYEGAVYQLLCDVMFIMTWINTSLNKINISEDSRNKTLKNNLSEWLRRFSNIEKALNVYVDTTTILLHKPYLMEAGLRLLECGHVSLDLLLAPCVSSTTSSPADRHPAMAELPTNIMQLAPSVRRFPLLPIPMDLIQSTSSPTSKEKSTSSPSPHVNNLNAMSKQRLQDGGDESMIGGGLSLLNNLRFKW